MHGHVETLQISALGGGYRYYGWWLIALVEFLGGTTCLSWDSFVRPLKGEATTAVSGARILSKQVGTRQSEVVLFKEVTFLGSMRAAQGNNSHNHAHFCHILF